MANSLVWSYPILVVTAAVLFYAALTDLRQFKISNELIIALVILFVLYAFVSGRWTSMHWNMLLAAFVFAVLLIGYNSGAVGGGDVKMLTVAFLWAGHECALPLAILLALFAAGHGLAAKFGWVRARQDGARQRIPFAPSIAAALIGTFMLGCFHPL